MAIEIERKFLVKSDEWRSLGSGELYAQGYIANEAGKTVRVRIVGDRGYLTIKGPGKMGGARPEFEYPIPIKDAQEMIETLCNQPVIEKTRYKISLGELIWEVDEFHGNNQGLILAEVELNSEDQEITIPDWIGAEVTSDRRYFNAYLAEHPYQEWGIN
ncbi:MULTISPECIES: CYTH domain-containing protein [Planktothricoides]|uniref:CYTH domain-containing protein n=1 Tax=Planktothricoides raciborskii GIHE-MW2 TaxID=2792601 RepID=A0AAU8JGB9_9CYAN|nr:CYTH domain-containing protein [Planktothricoides sp. SR001]KOR34350.1 adenylate cyclase [Planktothricoides sp. SR001]